MKFKGYPFDPLGADEIKQAASIIRKQHAHGCSSPEIHFRVVTLLEPPKKEMLTWLASTTSGETVALPKRIARVQAYVERRFTEFRVDLDTEQVLHTDVLHGRHAHIDAEYMELVGETCLRDEGVQHAIEALKLPDGATVVVEPWAYATDGMNDMTSRISMCWFYMRLVDHPDANYYAYPLDLCAEVSEELKVVKIYGLPTTEDGVIEAQPEQYDAEKIHVGSEYHPDLVEEQRSTTLPLHVVQPQGPSFQIQGNRVQWEKWSMHVGFNYREGLTLHNIRYEDKMLFYRLSLSEMFVPYGDSRTPFPRKGAFDLGNDGAGVNANNLKLGCDCLGTIKYFDAWHVLADGTPLKMPNVVCCHEIDDGILWKHTNFRTGNAVVARSRILVLQTIITVSNYEYIFAFHFSQDAAITYEIRATGILSTAPVDVEEQVSFGTVVAPGVLAPFHQHLFCLRIDPAIGGVENSLMVEETVSTVDEDAQKPGRSFGVGFSTRSKIVENESGLDLDFQSNRTFKIVNERHRNEVTGTFIGYKLIPFYSQKLLAHPDTFHAKRSEFAAHAVWVTRYDDEELYASGKYTMQSRGGEGIASWIEGRCSDAASSSNVRDEDIVLWHSFGSTHNPRIEDWPIMPCEKMAVTLKPINYFSRNPSLDVATAKAGGSHNVEVRSS